MKDSSKQARAHSVQDALLYSLDELGEINFLYMSALSGKTRQEIIDELYGVIFQNPEKIYDDEDQGWETADEYLSGDIYHKYNAALYACKKYGSQYEVNVKALENIFPKKLEYAEIYVTLGSPWLPTDVIDDFILELLGNYSQFHGSQYKVKHDTITGRWEIPVKSRYGSYHIPSISKYGTIDMNALNIIEKTLNHQAIYIKNPKQQPLSAVIRTSEEATMLVLDKQELILNEFASWLWSDSKRAERILDIYQRNYGCYRAKHINGAFLKLKEMNRNVALYPYQKDAVARIIMTPNTLLAHDVGAGKTFIMIAAGMELRRLGKSKKNLYVVPNNIIEQWNDIFLQLYPEADVFVANPQMFSPKKRRDTLDRIKKEDHDAIIMAYSSFDSIGCSRQWELKEREEELNRFEQELTIEGHDTSLLKRQITIKKKEYNDIFYRRQGSYVSSSREPSFDELGINTLFIDEAHNYKNIPLRTSINLLGINNAGSKKCEELLRKVRCVQIQNKGRGVVMATGTPITNSISDVYAFQKYLQYEALVTMGIADFSDWVGMYAGQDTNFEIDIDTSNFRVVSRLSRFHNIPELTALFSQVVDFHHMNQDGLPILRGREDCVVPATVEFRQFLEEISDRVDAIRSKRTEYRKCIKPDFMNNRKRRRYGQPDFVANDNMLCVTTDGRKGALDLRLVNYPVVSPKSTKIYACARNVFDIYIRTSEDRSTQLIFCDISTPKKEFNVYDEIKRQLISFGVKASDIAFVHDYEDELKRQELFDKVQSGDIRILLGSTFKLGIGVNVQNRLIALHHLDVPWRPADMTQREGRILRQGNMNEQVNIYRYVTEESFDAYSWQLLETKQRFISEILSGMAEARTGEEIGNTVLDYAEIKALAIGDPNIKIRVMLNNKLVRLRTLQIARTVEYEELSLELVKTKKLFTDAQAFATHLSKDKVTGKTEIVTDEDRREIRQNIYAAINRDAEVSRSIAIYRGFEVVVPARRFVPDPYVYLRAEGEYRVSVGKGEKLIMARIDKYIDSMSDKLEETQKRMEMLQQRILEINDTLANLPDYEDEITDVRQKLDYVDSELGINEITIRSRVLDN